MDFSVIVSTYNRSQNLPDCASALADQSGLEGVDWEVVVVDNNSSDDTAEVVRELAETHPIAIRYAFEREQGLSCARNRGIADSSSRYLAFIDDDIRVERQWLSAMVDGFREQRCDAVGGRILVESGHDIPDWIQPEMLGFLGQRDLSDQGFFMDGVKTFPFGGNMALSRKIIEKVGLFDTRMGRKGEGRSREELFKGEETDYFRRVAAVGGTMYYEPRAAVRHMILPHQLQKKFFRTIHYNAGYQNALLDTRSYDRTLSGIPFFLVPQTARAAWRYLGQLATKGPALAFRQQMNIGYFLGMMQGYRARRKQA